MANALTNGALPVDQGQQPPPPPDSSAPVAAPQPPQGAAPPQPGPTDQGAAPDAQAPAPDAGQAPPDQGQDDQPPITLQAANIDPEKLQDSIWKMAEMTVRMSALTEKPTVARSDVVSTMIKVVNDGIMNPVMASGFMTDLPESPDDVREWVQRHADKGYQLLAQMAYAQHGSAAPDQGAAPAPDDTGGQPPPQPPPQ